MFKLQPFIEAPVDLFLISHCTIELFARRAIQCHISYTLQLKKLKLCQSINLALQIIEMQKSQV